MGAPGSNWRFVAIFATTTTFGLGLVGCFTRGWHAPRPEMIAIIYALGVVLGVVASWARARPKVVVLAGGAEDGLVRARSSGRAELVASGVLGAATAAAGAVLVAVAIDEMRSLVLASLIGSLWMATYPLHVVAVHALIERGIVLGVDGLRVGRRRVAFREIRGATAIAGQRAIRVLRADGISMHLAVATHEAAELLAARITERLTPPPDVDVLRTRIARAGRPVAEWKRALASTDYRSREVSAEDAMRILSSGTAAPDERLGAALLLRSEEGRAHVRIVASQCLEPRLRVALEEVADGDLNETHILALEKPLVFRKRRRGAGER